MNATAALEKAILAIEGAIDEFQNKDEINISDLQSTLHEIRGTLWQETNGDSIVFPTHTVSLFGKDYYFRWPKGEDPIECFYVENGIIYATSSQEHDLFLEFWPDLPNTFRIPDYAVSVAVGSCSAILLSTLRVKKTNLKPLTEGM